MRHQTVRGRHKPGLNHTPPAPRCAALAVGSVPHVSPEAALDLILRWTPEIPTWPQLPRRSFLENMYVQFTEGLPGVRLDPDAGSVMMEDQVPDSELIVFVEAFEAGDLSAFSISRDYAAALPLLGEALSGLSPPYIKGQVTGPVSFALTITRTDKRAIFYDDSLRDLSAKLLAMKARWQETLLREWAPDSSPLIIFDEPYLTQTGSAYVSIPAAYALPILRECLLAVDCLTGIHVCGGTDWQQLAELPVDLLNFDAADHLTALLSHCEAVAQFLLEGGFLAWGVVPNDARAGNLTPESAGRRVVQGAEALAVAGGPDVDQILAASFICSACGTGSLEIDVAERCFEVASETSSWLRARLNG